MRHVIALALWLSGAAAAGSATSWSEWATPVVLTQSLYTSDDVTDTSGSSYAYTAHGSWVWLLRDSDTVRGGDLESVGDVNGDGAADYACDVARAGGVPLLGAGQFGVVLFLGANSSGGGKAGYVLPSQLNIFDTNVQTVVIPGAAYKSAADVTGDGLADLLLTCSGRLLLLPGHTGEWPTYVLPASLASMWAGAAGAVLPVGDVNGDGRADVALALGDGASIAVVLGSRNRSAFPLGLAGVNGTNAFVLRPATLFQSPLSFSARVVGVGDVNGDRLADIAIDSRATVLSAALTSVTVVFGRKAWSGFPDVALLDGVARLGPGYALLGAHYAPRNSAGVDVDGDRYADVLVLSEAREAVFLGRADFSGSSLTNVPVAFCASPNVSGALAAGDVTGDGVPDLVSRRDGGGECVVDIARGAFAAPATAAGCVASTGGARVMRLVGDGPCANATVDPVGDIDSDGLVDYYFEGHVALGALRAVNVSAGEGTEVLSRLDATVSGYSATGVGDVSGDALPDFAFALSNASTGLWDVVVVASSAWRAILFPVSAPADRTGWRYIRTPFAVADCSLSLAALGDHNGDAHADVLVGVVGRSPTGVRALVLLGPALAQVAYRTNLTGDVGRAVSALGDVDGDALADVGLETHGLYERYRAFVVYGARNLTAGSTVGIDGLATALPDSYGPLRGANVTGVGDVDGDGLADVVVDMARCGWLRLLRGRRGGLGPLGDGGLVLSPGARYGALPAAQDCAAQVVPRALGDVNGDAVDDFGLGVPTESNALGHRLAGRIYVVLGNASAAAWIRAGAAGAVVRVDELVDAGARAAFVVDGAILFDQLGGIFGAAGDVNGDGVGDMYVGMPEALATAGQVYVLLGRNDSADCDADGTACWSRRVDSAGLLRMSGFAATDGYQLVGADRGSRLGSFVGALGDIDGDRAGDIVIGSPVDADSPTRLFSGSLVVLGAQQMRLVAPAWPRGLADVAMDGSRSLRLPAVAVWTHRCGSVAGDGSASGSGGCTMQRSDPALTYTVGATTDGVDCEWIFSDDVVAACAPTATAGKGCAFAFTTAWNSTCAALVAAGAGWARFTVDEGFGGGGIGVRVAVNNTHGNTAGLDLSYSVTRPSKLAKIVGGSVGGFFGLVLLVVASGVVAVALYKRRLLRELTKWEPRVWRFDEALRPTAARAKPRDYYLLKPGRADVELVAELYQRCPAPGYDVAKVEIIYSPHLEQAFENRVAQLQARAGNAAFAPGYEHDGSAELRAAVAERLAGMAGKTPEAAYPNVKVVAMWHGTRAEALESVFRAGFASLATTDEGFFGKGVYSAYEARYASEVYSRGALLVNWVSLFSAFPVVDGDMPRLTGKGSYANYDAHFIPVRPASAEAGEQNYVACSELSQAVFHELVTFEASQNLPRYLVTLQPSIVKNVPALDDPRGEQVVARESGPQAQAQALPLPQAVLEVLPPTQETKQQASLAETETPGGAAAAVRAHAYAQRRAKKAGKERRSSGRKKRPESAVTQLFQEPSSASVEMSPLSVCETMPAGLCLVDAAPSPPRSPS
eukprot:m51a1_g8936 hypothetical protein (1547) ;mRNA; r:915616-920621